MSVRAFVSAEDEQFKLKINTENKKINNFRPHTHKINLSVCKNSFVAFQILLQCDNRVCIDLDDSPWFSEYDDAEIVYIRHTGSLSPSMNHIAMHHGDDNYLYADMLCRNPVIDVESDTPVSVYIKFEIPSDIKEGLYSGEFRLYNSYMFEDEKYLDKITYHINVHPVILPDIKNTDFELDLWQHNCNIARKAEVSIWSDTHFTIIEKYINVLSKLGQTSITAIVAQIPWSGQRCFLDKETPSNLFEYSMINVFKDDKGIFNYDYTPLDRYIRLCFKYGINKEIEVFGLINNWISTNDGYYNFTEVPDAIRIRYKNKDGIFSYFKKASDIEEYIIALHNHFIEMGWIDKVRVVADEPSDHESFRLSMNLLKKIAPQFKYKADITRKAFFDEFKNDIEVFCVSLTGIGDGYDEWKKLFKNDTKHKFTFYVCCFPEYPNIFLSNNLLEIRYMLILADYFGFKGFLRWNFTVWPQNPRKDIRYSMWPAGDTNFVYPAGDMTPLLTLRYMTLRRGIEDYQLLQMLKIKGDYKTIKDVQSIIIQNTDFKNFFSDNTNKIKFEAMSTVKTSDYQKIRDMMYNSLSNNI